MQRMINVALQILYIRLERGESKYSESHLGGVPLLFYRPLRQLLESIILDRHGIVWGSAEHGHQSRETRAAQDENEGPQHPDAPGRFQSEQVNNPRGLRLSLIDERPHLLLVIRKCSVVIV